MPIPRIADGYPRNVDIIAQPLSVSGTALPHAWPIAIIVGHGPMPGDA